MMYLISINLKENSSNINQALDIIVRGLYTKTVLEMLILVLLNKLRCHAHF